MSSIKVALAATLLTAALSAAAADEVACPQRHAVGGKAGYLDSADVYEGPPANLVSLMPDLDTWEWQLEVEQKAARQAGESLYLVCRYKGINAVVQLKIPYPATFCRVTGTRNRTDAACKPPAAVSPDRANGHHAF